MVKANVLVVVDMQDDFVDGSLGSEDAANIVPAVVEKIKEWDGPILATQDTHYEDYFDTLEGKLLPVKHCLYEQPGWDFNKGVKKALYPKDGNKWVRVVIKNTFGSLTLPTVIKRLSMIEPESITLVGLCTDICVVSNALILRAKFPDVPMYVDSKCCAGTTKDKHEAALKVMESRQIIVL